MVAARFQSHEEYLATLSPAVRERLVEVRAAAEHAVGGADRVIAYNMPALRRGRVFFYFAAFRKHIGIYPPVSCDAELIGELRRWRGPRGNLQFPLSEPVPLELVARVARALAAEYAGG